MKQKIIDYIRRNRVSSTEVADCLGKTGQISKVSPVNRGHFCVGEAHWSFAYEGTNWMVHKEVADAPEESVVIVDAHGCDEKAIFGDLVSKYLMLYRQVKGIVVCGLVRDVPRIIKEAWPIWSEGFSPIGCSNFEPEVEPPPERSVSQIRYTGSVIIADDSGAVVIEESQLTSDFYHKLEDIERQEDIWFDCIDRKKWNTFDTVCLKRYLEND